MTHPDNRDEQAKRLTHKIDKVNSSIDNHPVARGFIAIAASATIASNAFVGMMNSASVAGIHHYVSLPFAGLCAVVLGGYSFRVVMAGLKALAEKDDK